MTEQKKTMMRIFSNQDLADALVQLRISSGLTQQQASDDIDINRAYLSRLETGETSNAQVERTLELISLYGGKLIVEFPDGED